MWWGRDRSPDDAVDSNTGNLSGGGGGVTEAHYEITKVFSLFNMNGCVELFWRDNKCALLHKLSCVILLVSSHEKNKIKYMNRMNFSTPGCSRCTASGEEREIGHVKSRHVKSITTEDGFYNDMTVFYIQYKIHGKDWKLTQTVHCMNHIL